MMLNTLRVFALGGLGEIGLNLTVLEYEDEILIIDCGVLFPDLYWLGLDLILPDFNYLIENEKKIKGMVITHGHEDHIGAIPFLLKNIQIPIIYCSRFAARLITDKCSEHKVGERLVIHKVKAGDDHDLGRFNVEFIHITHSTLESFALAITTPCGVVVHSGDFKFDEKPYKGLPSDKLRLREIGRKKPILLLSDSTNSEKCGHSESESSINEELEKLVKQAPGAAIIALFASNVHRVHQLIDIADKLGRKVFLSGRSMVRYVNIAIEEKFLPAKLSLLRPIDEISRYKRNEVLVLSTGSQGESRSGLLRLANNENSNLKIQKGDVVILSSRSIPGNERAISYVVNQLFRLGATVHYEDQKRVHVSGHAYQSEQLELLKLIKPKFFIPVHGEYRHLVTHAETAKEFGIPEQNVSVIENGQIWEFKKGSKHSQVKETIRTGRRWIFQDTSGEIDALPIKERKKMARSGVVVVDCLTSARPPKLVDMPKVTLKGFLCSDKIQSEISKLIERKCIEAFENWIDTGVSESMTREQVVGAAAHKVVKKALDVKPLIIVNFLKVN